MQNIFIADNLIIKKKNNYYNFKIDEHKNNKNNKYSIILKSNNKINIQFKLNTKFIDDVEFKYINTKYDAIKIPFVGILINCELNYKNEFNIHFTMKDLCCEINIFDIQILNDDLPFTKIIWDKIYIINLLKRIDRRESIINKLNKMKLTNYEFIDGIDGTDQNVIDEFKKLKNKTSIINEGHYGCLLSHIKALEQAKKLKLKSIMILEDDVIFDDDFLYQITNINVPVYNMIYLGGIINNIKFFLNGWGIGDEIMGAYAYIVNEEFYDQLLNFLKTKQYCVDISFAENIKPQDNVIILNDLIKTDLTSSDTSAKNKIMIEMFKKTLITPQKSIKL